MMRSSPHEGWAGTALALALLGTTGCWDVVGVEDRRAIGDQDDELGPPNNCPLVSVESPKPVCAACLQENCCAELLACSESEACRACLFPSDAVACTAPPEQLDLKACVRGPCAEPCVEPDLAGVGLPFCNVVNTTLPDGECAPIGGYFGRFECNPVSNVPCAPGETCALDEGLTYWTCRGSGHALPVCAACGFAEGECAPGHGCLNGVCYRYCCTDEDCGAPASGATCRKPLPGVDGGVCERPED